MSSLRILWADDQPDVQATLATLLDSLDSVIVSVTTGEQALEALGRERFDLAIIDLQMPPTDWGGLWLLERLSEAGNEVPVIVLSGEGSQRETIQAMRLGARDYVMKDHAAEDLLARVGGVRQRWEDERLERLQAKVPAPVGVPLARYRASVEPTQRLRSLISVFEASARLLAIYGITEASAAGSQGLLKVRETDRLGRPSFGTWVDLAKRVVGEATASSLIAEWGAVVPWSALHQIVQLRNSESHGDQLSSAAAASECETYLDALGQMLEGATRAGRLVLVSGLQYREGLFDITGVVVEGSNPVLPGVRLKGADAVEAGAHLVETEADHLRRSFPVGGWLRVVEARLAAEWQVMVFDGWQRAGSGAGQVRLRGLWDLGPIPTSGPTATTRSLPGWPETD